MSETTSVLTAKRVHEIFVDCLFRDDENHENLVKAEGLTMTVEFHPERLAGHKDEIGRLLDELPNEFKASGGGGWSFLNACIDKHGRHWAEHSNIQELLLLGIATGQAEFQMPRDMWSVMPGGMPYFLVK